MLPDAAAGLAARAAALTPPDDEEALARRRIRTAEYRYRAEDIESARAGLSELVAELPAGELRAEALLWLACVRQAQNGIAEAVELARRALAEARRERCCAPPRNASSRCALVVVGADVAARGPARRRRAGDGPDDRRPRRSPRARPRWPGRSSGSAPG